METPQRRRPGRGVDQSATRQSAQGSKGIRQASERTRSRPKGRPGNQDAYCSGILRQYAQEGQIVTPVRVTGALPATRRFSMNKIVPRWEWRTFGTQFGVAETRFAELTPGDVQESDELYFLGGQDANVKVRDDLLDVKVLREVNADGLERWEPVMKKAFPLPAADAEKVFASLHLVAPQLNRDAYTLDQFMGELVLPGRALRPVKVHKRRVRYTVGGCISEFSDVRANEKATRTIAIEAEDAAAVVSAVASVGLG